MGIVMKELIKFNYDDSDYLVYKENGAIRFKVNDEKVSEKNRSVLYEVLNALTAGDNLLEVCNIRYSDRDYAIYKDSDKNIFLPIPFDPAIIFFLNKTFNAQSDFVNYNGYNLKDSFKRLVKIGKQTVVVLLATSICLSTTGSMPFEDADSREVKEVICIGDIKSSVLGELQIDKVEDDVINDLAISSEPKIEEPLNSQIDENALSFDVINISNEHAVVQETSSQLDESELGLYTGDVPLIKIQNDELNKNADIADDNSLIDSITGRKGLTDNVGQNEHVEVDIYQLLLNALSKNQNLTEEEKSYFLELEKMFNDNIDVLDLDFCMHNLETVYTIYSEEKADQSGVKAMYSFLGNYIICYNAKSISDVPKDAFTHEIEHMFDKTTSNFNPFFVETANTIFNNEYHGDSNDYVYDTAYCDQVGYMYALIEIVGSEPIRKYQFNHDINIIQDALCGIVPDIEKAQSLISYLDLFLLVSQGKEKDFDISDIQNKLSAIISGYYEARFNRPMTSDLLMLLYTNGIDYYELCELFQLNSMGTYVWNNYTISMIRYYFNSGKLNSSEVAFSIPDIDEYGKYSSSKIVISDENRYLEDYSFKSNI